MRSITLTYARPGKSIALAIALLAGTAVVGTVALEAPAQAQKQKKPKLSKGFTKAYGAIQPLLAAEPTDEAAVRAAIPAMLEAAETPDDQNYAGNLLLSAGTKFDDQAMRVQGINMMIDSGQDNERIGLLSYAKFQAYDSLGNIQGAREALIDAYEAGYSFEGRLSDGSASMVSPGDLRVMAAQVYWDNDQYAEGLADLKGWIEGLIAAGEPVDDTWLRRGFSTAFNNDLGVQASEFSTLMLETSPSAVIWSDAIAVQSRFFDYDSQEGLDLMRLARRTGVLSGDRLTDPAMAGQRDLVKSNMTRFYLDYAEWADFRRLPGEVKAVLEEGIAAGVLDANDVTVADTLSGARGRIAADQRDLPGLERDARATSSVTTVMAAGDAFLSYGQSAKAEEFYAKALTLPGADTERMRTRLGIAQADQGKYAEAKATFEAVSGKRERIADLWAVYVSNKMKDAGGM